MPLRPFSFLLLIFLALGAAGCSSSSSQDPAAYDQYLVVEKIDHKVEFINPHLSNFCTYTATIKNTGSQVVTDVEGYWQLKDVESREYREKIHFSRPLMPGATGTLTLQVRNTAQFGNPAKVRKLVFEKIKVRAAGKSS